jgi:spore germination cell wall hydrolase CwlJ-like protein
MYKLVKRMAILCMVCFSLNSAHASEEPYHHNKINLNKESSIHISNNNITLHYSDKQIQCIARNIYFESRSEPLEGQRAVAWVTINRAMSKKYPSLPCDVVHQSVKDKKGNPKKNKCQFSWYCDRKKDKIKTNDADYKRAVFIARSVSENYFMVPDPTSNAVMYHTKYTKPSWTKSYSKTSLIGNHIFYKEN